MQHGLIEGLYAGRSVDGYNGSVMLRKELDGLRLVLQYIADEFIWYEEQNEAKFGVEELLYDGGTFSHEDAGTCLEIEGTMGRVPDLLPLDHINDIISVAPEVFILIL